MSHATTTDEKLELAIEQAGTRVQALYMRGKVAESRAAFEEVKKLVAQRSPEQVDRMERERGLAHG